MKGIIQFVIVLVFFTQASAQQQRIIKGTVLDAKTGVPLSRATIKVKSQQPTDSGAGTYGEFEIQIATSNKKDSLEISHLGYKTFKKRIEEINSPLKVLLEDYSQELKTITITSRKVNMKLVDNALRKVKDNLYVYETETTNGLYNLFLNFLEEQDQTELFKLCIYDLSAYDEVAKNFYKEYVKPFKAPPNKQDTTVKDYTDYPAVNISHEGAILFCQWFTEQYNSNTGKKKFKNVKFRLPTLQEWQIAALGYPKFQSWNLDENTVEVTIPPDTISESRQGKKTVIPVNQDILYPWWMAYNYRNKAQNQNNCFLGNFRILPGSPRCNAKIPGYDGWIKMAKTSTYFPNGMGLYDVVGNVAEMIDEKGKACGGSWNDVPKESTIRSVKTYTGPHDTVGFRVFMEVVE